MRGGSPNRARPSALRALATLGKQLERHERVPILEQLVDLLRDSWYGVAWAAARALGTLGDPTAIPALETFGRALSVQEEAAVNRIIDDLRSQDKTDGSAQQKQLDTLRDKVRTLEEQLQKVTAHLDRETDQDKADVA
jgi:hypothetical protein